MSHSCPNSRCRHPAHGATTARPMVAPEEEPLATATATGQGPGSDHASSPVDLDASIPAGTSILRTLGIVGLEPIEPVILAALATEAPVLLVGPHGTAKSLLLSRLCEALGLEWRHYNASLLNYDDLVGYPLPDGQGSLRFIQTPASIWQAEAVFLDEISRSRVDMQNRLFPIIHERKVQGLPLTRLRYRWAAMNPPTNRDTLDDDPYVGSARLDDALADRFPFIVGLPSFAELSSSDRVAVIQQRLEPVGPDTTQELRDRIAEIRDAIPVVEATCGAHFARYVDAVGLLASDAGWSLSGRRATMLFWNIVAVSAAIRPRAGTSASAATWVALRSSIPAAATGRGRIEDAKLRVIHSEAWHLADMDLADPRRALLAERDPVRRSVLAVSLPIDRQARSATVADALATLAPGERHALALHLAGTDGIDLYPAVAEEVANLVAEATVPHACAVRVKPGTPREQAGRRITAILDPSAKEVMGADRAAFLGLLPKLFASGVLDTEADVTACVNRWRDARARLGYAPPGATDRPRGRAGHRREKGADDDDAR
jgi:MoxR-like ATPase